jgi:hypothetical protein
VVPETEAVRLRRLASGLTVGRGTDRNGQEFVTINSVPYREKDSFGVNDPVLNTRVILQVVRISGGNLTLKLGNSEFTLTK